MRFKNVKNLFSSMLISGIILSLFAVTACGGGGGGGDDGNDAVIVYDPINTSYAKTIKGGADVDITAFSGSNIYALLAFMPSNKRESDYAPTTSSDWELFSAADLTPSKISPESDKDSFILSRKSYSGKKVFSSSQTEWDLKMRNSENKSLASKSPQFSKTNSGRYSAAPATIIVGTAWTGITMAVTGNTIAARCRYISDHAYFFVDQRDIDIDDPDVTVAKMTTYGTAFDLIYDVNHAKFGNENDVDNNGKVIIIFSREITDSMLGYFYDADKFAYNATTNPDSNEGDIFYMTADGPGEDITEDTICGTLAHEFQHMIYFDEHYNRGVDTTYAWLNEALSQAAEYYNNYLDNHEAWIKSYLDGGWFGLSLTHWTQGNYGYGAIFIRYLMEQYGDTAIKNMCATKKIGVAAVESATGEDFNTIFYNFTLALAMSGTGDTADPKYNFTNLDLQTVQPLGRGGLIQFTSASPAFTALAAGSGINSYNYPYEIFFVKGSGNFESMNLSGTEVIGTAFGLSQ